MTEERRED